MKDVASSGNNNDDLSLAPNMLRVAYTVVHVSQSDKLWMKTAKEWAAADNDEATGHIKAPATYRRERHLLKDIDETDAQYVHRISTDVQEMRAEDR
jgi:hypothetical protein